MANYVDIVLSIEIQSDPDDMEAVMQETHGVRTKERLVDLIGEGDYYVSEPYDDN